MSDLTPLDDIRLSLSAAARAAGMDRRTLRKYLRNHQLVGIRTPRGWRIEVADLAEFRKKYDSGELTK